ncbi:MAG: hypothetical protein ACU84Q_13465 [Gammaproteobacteria bacterium]
MLSEAEQLETAALYFDLALSSVMMYLSLVSGYVAIAYFVGARLNKGQVIFVTMIFITFALFTGWGSSGFFFVAEYFYRNAESYQYFPTDEWIPAYIVVSFVEIMGIIIALIFMRDVRRKALPSGFTEKQDQTATENSLEN